MSSLLGICLFFCSPQHSRPTQSLGHRRYLVNKLFTGVQNLTSSLNSRLLMWRREEFNYPHQNKMAGKQNKSDNLGDIPFSRPQFRRAHSLFGPRKDVSDSESSQRIFLFPLVSQGSRAEVQYEEKAIQQTPGAQQLEVLIVLLEKVQKKDMNTEILQVTRQKHVSGATRPECHRDMLLTSPPARRELQIACPIMS